MRHIYAALYPLLALVLLLEGQYSHCQDKSLEQRQPLELVFADSIVPQDRHELMLTAGAWYFRRGDLQRQSLTQKGEWGLSDQLQISVFSHLLQRSNEIGRYATGAGDLEIGARYTWPKVGSEFTHIALALDTGFPIGDPRRGLGEGAYTVSPSLLFSREFRMGKYQLFSTNGAEFVTARSRIGPSENILRHTFFSNSGMAMQAGHGWTVAEISADSNRWSGGDETRVMLAPSYVWRLARRTELLFGIPVGLSSSTDRIGVAVKFTFELGGRAE
jgi:hypothetical protein